MDFGAFVKLEPGVEGLIHISELGHGRVFRTSDVVSEGQEVEVKILSVDTEKQRISLSLKALLAAPEKAGPAKGGRRRSCRCRPTHRSRRGSEHRNSKAASAASAARSSDQW